jgi:hypothetical protein
MFRSTTRPLSRSIFSHDGQTPSPEPPPLRLPRANLSFYQSKVKKVPLIRDADSIETLDLSGNPISSFKGLRAYHRLKVLKFDGTKICSFVGAVAPPSLRHISLSATPLAAAPHYREMVGIVFGPQLETIDHRAILRSERRAIQRLRPLVRDLLLEGWLLTLTRPLCLVHAQTRLRRRILVHPQAPKAGLALASLKQVSEFSFILRLHALFFRGKPRDLQKHEGEVKPFLNYHCPELCDSFVNTVLMAFNLRPLHIQEIVEFVKNVSDNYVLDLLKEDLKGYPFTSHFLMASVLESLFQVGILKEETVRDLTHPIFESFVDFAHAISLSPGLAAEPFIKIFCPFSNLLERVAPELFQDLFVELLSEDNEFLNEYSTFMRIRKYQNKILSILKRDDASAYAGLSDDDLEMGILRLFGVVTTDVRVVAAALCGAQSCLRRVQMASDDTFQKAAVWGNCQAIAKTLDPAVLSEYAIFYHRYDFPLSGNPALASLAVEAENVIALEQLAARGVQFTSAILEEAIEKRKLASFFFLTECAPITQSAFKLALELEELRMVHGMIRSGAIDVNAPVDAEGSTALHIAARLGLMRATALLLTVPEIDVDAADARGALPWSVARRSGHQDIANLIQGFRDTAASRSRDPQEGPNEE